MADDNHKPQLHHLELSNLILIHLLCIDSLIAYTPSLVRLLTMYIDYFGFI